jgi:branched-chain amino acid transport system substrate-binding protein
MKKRAVFAAAALGAVATTALVATTIASAHPAKVAKASAISCKSTLKLGLVTPLTGGAAFLGQEQLSWAKYAIKTLPRQYRLKVNLVQFDTPVEQGPAPAQAAAQKFVADKSVVGIIGPSTSGAVVASTKTYFQAGIAQVSESATHTDLTIGTAGDPYVGSPAFFRVVPGDYIQGPSDAAFMVKNLHVKKVVLFDFQEPYSLGLSSAAEGVLKKAGVTTIHLSAPNTTTDYSSYVSRVPSDTDVVFFPTQKPGDAQTVATQLKEQGKKATVFGGDGSNDPSHFKVAGSYVSNFAPDITGIPADKGIVAGWKHDNPGKAVGSFGPPTYLAVQVMLRAIQLTCKADGGTLKKRADVISHVKKVQIKNSILGGTFSWSTKTNDPHNAKFYIFQIQSNGSYKLVG